MAEGPLNPPNLGDFEDMLPQIWGLGGLKNPSLRRQYFQYFQVLNQPAASRIGGWEVSKGSHKQIAYLPNCLFRPPFHTHPLIS